VFRAALNKRAARSAMAMRSIVERSLLIFRDMFSALSPDTDEK
jgi:hypothetical protein